MRSCSFDLHSSWWRSIWILSISFVSVNEFISMMSKTLLNLQSPGGLRCFCYDLSRLPVDKVCLTKERIAKPQGSEAMCAGLTGDRSAFRQVLWGVHGKTCSQRLGLLHRAAVGTS